VVETTGYEENQTRLWLVGFVGAGCVQPSFGCGRLALVVAHFIDPV